MSRDNWGPLRKSHTVGPLTQIQSEIRERSNGIEREVES